MNPRPNLEEGRTEVYGFAVDTPIPTINIPLSGDDKFALDFDAVYQRTYTSIGGFSHEVDYEQFPVKFKRYSVDDQERIRQVMQRATAVQLPHSST